MTNDDDINVAIQFARQNKKRISQELVNSTLYFHDEFPVSVFMAGSPGAGKTESSVNLIRQLAGESHSILRIDSDDLRQYFANYNGSNSSTFVSATSIIADKIHDVAIEKRLSFVFDGTFSSHPIARKNIIRSLKHNRFVQIVYVYQDPLQAWQFVKARERRDGRVVPRDAFISKYFGSRECVNLIKMEFGGKIRVDVIVKNIDGTDFMYRENIDVIDNYIPETYTKNQLEKLIL